MSRWHSLIAFLIVLLMVPIALGANQFGVADKRVVQFDKPFWIAGILAPAGTYEVRHMMEGADHVMLFSLANVKHAPAPVQARCTLVPQQKPVQQTETAFRPNEKGELVLVRMQFKGDHAVHMF
jgi:hypothetical protein